MGKSEWLDALIMNLAETYGWAAALCSFEKSPVNHLIQLVEKHKRKPFRHPPAYLKEHAAQWERMDVNELRAGLEFAAEHFCLIHNAGDDVPTIDWVLDRAQLAVLRWLVGVVGGCGWLVWGG